MANFNLSWNNALVNASSNALNQSYSFRQKSTGGPFIYTSGGSYTFVPANPLLKSANSSQITGLLDNTIYEFRVEAACTIGGPTFNDNGVIEQIKFACLTPSLSQTDTSGTFSLTGIPSDISAVAVTLRRTSDNVIISGPTLLTPSSGNVSQTITGLTASTGYYWQYTLSAIVNSATQTSSLCTPFSFTTDAPPACPAPTSLAVVPA